MRFLPPSVVLIAAALTVPGGLSAADDLAAVLTRIDQAAASFHGLSADIRKVKHTPVIPEDDVQTGKILVRRVKPHEVQVRIDIDPPDEQTIVLDGTKIEIYYPKTKTIQPYILGKAKPMVEQVLILGFGGTSQDLKSAYEVKYGGQETVAGQKAARLELTPKDSDLASHLTKVELWISEEPSTTGIGVQVEIYQKGGEYNLATYTNMKLRNVSESEIKLVPPKGTVREKPIKG